MSTTKPEITAELQALFDTAQDLQHAFWDALRELEEALGENVEIDSNQDLGDTSLETLIEEGCTDEDEDEEDEEDGPDDDRD